jgi:small subunit ribosomal protein S20
MLKREVQNMPNIKSAIKRVSVIEKKTLRNNMVKSGYKSAVKKFEQAVEAGNKEEATKLLALATKKVDQACTKGVIVKNTAARKKSNMAKKLNAMNA